MRFVKPLIAGAVNTTKTLRDRREGKSLRIVHRYILREHVEMFALCLLGFVIIMLSGFLYELADLMIGKRVPFTTVLTIAGYKMPELISQVIPASALFATLLTLTRLGCDRELDIMRLCGWGYTRLIIPILIVGVILSGLTFAISDNVVPAANHAYQNMVRNLIFEDALPFIQENIFFRGPENRIFYIKSVNNKTGVLNDVMIFEVRRHPYPQTIMAESAVINKEEWVLNNGVRHEYDAEGFVNNEVSFDRLVIDTQADLSSFIGEQKTTSEMTRKELAEQIELFSKTGFNVDVFKVDYHLKAAAPVAALVLVVIGCAFSLMASGSGRILGLVASTLFTLLYYVLESVFRTLGTHSILNPVLAAWGANITFLSIAALAYLFARNGWRINFKRK